MPVAPTYNPRAFFTCLDVKNSPLAISRNPFLIAVFVRFGIVSAFAQKLTSCSYSFRGKTTRSSFFISDVEREKYGNNFSYFRAEELIRISCIKFLGMVIVFIIMSIITQMAVVLKASRKSKVKSQK